MALKEKISAWFSGFSPFNMFMLFIAGVVNAAGVTIFIAPVNLYDPLYPVRHLCRRNICVHGLADNGHPAY